ncbi:hypothetical protein EUX98_g1322 [Antrodiella citrinella]|uniref:Uncharacterized protein n=1 Tax=Antrodiella citrinella TaxID=2447956 RepID=A0A4S4N1Q6_9APHY|nr:hypothetical protein EUX98_g1322 [Antrodiella citrinella]
MNDFNIAADDDDDYEAAIRPRSGRDNAVLDRLPPLIPAQGPPLHFEGIAGGATTIALDSDPRVEAVRSGFPISIHPLRLPNTRGRFAAGVSLLDFRFLRIAGLLHKMVPLREGVDEVVIKMLIGGGDVKIHGRVTVVFDAQGYEFEHTFWVTNLGFNPFEMQLGDDFSAKFGLSLSFNAEGQMGITKADAKKARKLEDVYVVQ